MIELMGFIKRRIGWILVIIGGAVIPFVLWSFTTNFTEVFQSYNSVALAIGRLTGLMGVCFYSLNLILSSRWKFIESWFGGLNRVYIAHHLIGGLALVLLLFHPIMLAIDRISISWVAAAQMLLPDRTLAKDLGSIALIGLVVLLIITYYPKLPYQLWKLLHKFLGVFFGIAALHIILIESYDMESNILLKLYIYGVIFVGGVAYAYRTVLPKIFVRKYQYVVEKVSKMPGDVVEIVMRPLNRMMNFRAGQFVFIQFPHSKFVPPEQHPFSIVAAPKDNTITIASKMLGDYTSALLNVAKDEEALIEGAYGRFSYSNYKNTNQIWVAGGIGVTPFVSMARDIADKPNMKVDLYYSCKSATEFLYLDVLFYDLAKHHPNFRIITWATDKMGNITADKIKELSGEVANKEIFICGPPPMMRAMREQFKSHGVKNESIHTEEFALENE